MGRFGFVGETMGDALNLCENPDATGEPLLQLAGEDARAVRDYLEEVAAKPQASRGRS